MEEYLTWLIIALVGIGAGAYGVLVGAGGGFILSPVLLLLAVSDPKDVPGTVLAAIAINGAFVAWTYRKVGIVDYRSGLLFAAAAVPGAVIGALGVKFVSSDMLKVAFGVLLVLLAVQLATPPLASPALSRGETASQVHGHRAQQAYSHQRRSGVHLRVQ